MSTRRRLNRSLLIAAPIIGGLLLIVGLLLVFLPRGPALPEHTADFSYMKIDPPQTAPDFTLSDQFGKTVKMSDFEGKTVVLAFWYASCPHACPITAYSLALVSSLAKERLGDVAEDAKFLAVTVDPERDTQEQRKWFVDTFVEKYSGNLLFLGGDPSELAQVWDDYEIDVIRSSTSEYMQQLNVTEQELVAQIERELEDQIHQGLPREMKTDIMKNLNIAIFEDYYLAHKDAIYVIKDGQLKFQVFGHEINPESFAQLLVYLEKS